jgi:hypothetical protein
MTNPRHDHALALLAAGYDTGIWDEYGRPAPWPDDITEWRPVTRQPITVDPGEEPFQPTRPRKINRYTTSRECAQASKGVTAMT